MPPVLGRSTTCARDAGTVGQPVPPSRLRRGAHWDHERCCDGSRCHVAERDHLYRLARLSPPADSDVSDDIPPGLRRVLNRLSDTAVAVFAADWQLIWWNRGWAALLGDPSSPVHALRNFARDTFPVADDQPHLSRWPVTSLAAETVEAAVVPDLALR